MHRSEHGQRRLHFSKRGLWAIGILLIVLAIAVPGCSPGLVPARQGLVMRNVELPVRQLVFPSGLRVVAERDARNPIVGLFLVVGAGSSSDPPGKEGLAHYVEHLAFRSRPFGKSSFRHLLERAGAGEWNAYTSLDATVYHEVGPASGILELLRLEGARMLAPVANVTPETLAVELDVVRSELRERNETGFTGEVLGALQRVVFPPGHPYARAVIGSHESLTSIQEDDVRAFLQSHYQPSNMTLGIVGDIDLATIDGVVERALPPDLVRARPFHPRSPIPERAPEPPNPTSPVLTRGEASVPTPEIWIGWSLPRAFDADTHLTEMLVEAAASELSQAQAQWRRGHSDRDIAFVDTRLVPGKDASMLVCRVALHEGSHPEQSLEHVLNFVHEVWTSDAGVAASQIDGILFGGRQRRAVVSMLLETENIVEHGTTRALTTHFTQNPLTYARSVEKLLGLTRESFIDYAEKYLVRDRARAVFFKPGPGGALAKARPIGGHQIGEEDLLPLRVDAARLADIAPAPGIGKYRQFELPNGLKVVLGKREGAQTTSVSLLVRGGFGAASNPAAALLALKLARAPRWNTHGGPLEFGAHSWHVVGEDEVRYELEGSSGNTGMMLAILAETVRGFDVRGDDQKYFREFIAPYFRLAERKPEVVAHRAFLTSLLSGHPYGRSPTADDLVEASKGGGLQDWIDATHSPTNSVLAVIGGIEPEEVATIVRSEFGGWDRGPRALSIPAPYEPKRAQASSETIKVLVTERPGATQTQIQLGCNLRPANSVAEEIRHDVAAQLVENRLGEILRQQVGITYGVYARSQVLRGGTAFLDVQGAVERGKLASALQTIREAMWDLGKAPPTEKDLAWAKLRVARAWTTAYVTNRGIAAQVLRMSNLGFPLESRDATSSYIASAEASGVQEDIRACAAGGITVSLVGDEKTIHAALQEMRLR